MPLFEVDPERCSHDGLCVAACPLGIIEMPDHETPPRPTTDAQEICIECGQCVAVCPQAALSHRAMTPDQCPPMRKTRILDPEETERFMRMRRSIRAYKDKSVPRETLSRLIEIARYAPTGHNCQCVDWLVLSGKERIRELSGMAVDWMREFIQQAPALAEQMHMDRIVDFWDKDGMDYICRGAPHIIIAHSHKEDVRGQTASIIALTYLELAALSFELGTCWAGFFGGAVESWPLLKEAAKLPADHCCHGAMMVGYPQFSYQRLPLRKTPNITWV
jgi:nitroreductase/NAD-dependent dihydropyrimidine dehydrogenase PreA subunit